MKIQLRHTSIDYSLFDGAILHETFGLISFRVKGDIDDKDLQLPLVFQSGRSAMEAYRRILQGRNNSASSVSISDIDCSWPMETAHKIEQYAQSLFDFDRPVNL